MAKHMLEIPEQERPYEKCLRFGEAYLSDAELLSVILRTGTADKSALDLSREVLEKSKVCQNILGIYQMSLEDLQNIHGIGKVKAIQIKCIGELSKRISKASAREQLSMNSPERIASYCMEEFRHCSQEEMLMMVFDTKCQLIGERVLSRGTVNCSVITPREIFIEALHRHGVFVVLVHNHPSGDPTPSDEDIQLTKRVRKSGNMIGIELIDHLIIGDRKYVSLREKGML